ncbi:MAG: hypothetical protein IT460_05555 [Planctomycetes bacterium]|nr:hypothetical protein [Planctomycetota bacterium]
MVRTLSYVALLALVAGLAVGVFVSEVFATARTPEPTRTDPVVEQKVQLYVARYGLGDAEADAVRGALRDYDQAVLDLLRRLRTQHRDEFQTLSERADARIRAVLGERAR